MTTASHVSLHLIRFDSIRAAGSIEVGDRPGVLFCGDDPLRKEFAAQRAAGLAALSTRFKRAVAEGDLPPDTDADALASYVQSINFGLTVQASTGATRKELLRITEITMKAWPSEKSFQRSEHPFRTSENDPCT